MTGRHLAGLALAAALGLLLWWLAANWGWLADPAGWTGVEALAPLGFWLGAAKWPLLVVAAALILTAANRLAERTGLGH